MQLITRQTHVDRLPESNFKTHIQMRFDQLSKDTDIPPIIVLIEKGDDITSLEYAFVGPDGLLSDIFEDHESGHLEFSRPY